MRSKFTVLERRTMPIDLVALVEQELGEVGAVLAGDAGDQRPALCLRRHQITLAGACAHGVAPGVPRACAAPLGCRRTETLSERPPDESSSRWRLRLARA